MTRVEIERSIQGSGLIAWAVVFGSGNVYLYDDFALAKKIADGLTHHVEPIRVRVQSLTPASAEGGTDRD